MLKTETIYFKIWFDDIDQFSVKPLARELAAVRCFPKIINGTANTIVIKTGPISNPERAQEIISIFRKHGFTVQDRKIHQTRIDQGLKNLCRGPFPQNSPFGRRPRRRRRCY